MADRQICGFFANGDTGKKEKVVYTLKTAEPDSTRVALDILKEF